MRTARTASLGSILFAASVLTACSSHGVTDAGAGDGAHDGVASDSFDATRSDTVVTDSTGIDSIATLDVTDIVSADVAPADVTVTDTGSDSPTDSIGTDSGSCGAPGVSCTLASDCCSGQCSAGVCMAGTCGIAGTHCTTAADCCSASCVASSCTSVHIGALDDDRDRVLDTLSQVHHETDRCAQWTHLDSIQKGLFLTHSDMLGNRNCMTNASITSGALDSSGNCGSSNNCRCPAGSDMAFAHVFKLWTVNGSDPTCSCTEGSDGFNCCNGGAEWHRIFFTADDQLIDSLRRVSAALPEFGASTDIAGPHAPFTQSDETIQGSPRGQTHFWANDSQATTLTRNGVNGVLEPHIVELDNDYNIVHDSNPEGCYGFFGLGCTYGRIEFRQNWVAFGNQATTTFRANGEPSSHSELAADPIYAPRCPTSQIDTVAATSIRQRAVIAIQGHGFTDCAAHVGCGNEIHIRTHSTEMVIGPGSPFDLAESATEIRVQIPAESGTGEAYVWVVVGGVLSNLSPVTIVP